MRHSLPRAGRLALALLAAAALVPARARAQAGDRLDVTAFGSRDISRLHSIQADTLGLSYETSLSGGAAVDFRVLDLPFGKGARKPALHLLGGVSTDERVLGPAVPGQLTAEFPVIDFSTGIVFQAPLDAFVSDNAGVDVRIGWEGGYMLTRTGGQNFLERSKTRLAFVRSSGGLAGSSLGIGYGRDEVYGWDASSKRWDVALSLQGRVLSAPAARDAGRTPAGAKAAAAPGERLLWLFADVDLDTDGGPGADGLRARAGVGVDVNAFVTAAFTPLHP